MKWRFLSVCILVAASTVSAQTVDPDRKPSMKRAAGQAVWAAATQGRTTRIGEGGGMTVIAPVGAATAGAAAGSAKVTGTAVVTAGGVRVPTTISAEVGKEAMVGAVVGCATGGIAGCVLGTLTPLAIAYMSLSGTRINPQTGVPEIKPSNCDGVNCYRYQISAGGFSTGSPAFSATTAEGVCTAAAAWYAGSGISGSAGTTFVMLQGNACRMQAPGGPFLISFARVVSGPDSGTWNPSTSQELRHALYKNNPPVTLHDELAKFGNIVWTTGIPQITGPASISGPKSTTTNPDGSTTTSQTTTPITYGPGTVTAGNPTTTTTSRNAEGTETGTTTTTTEPGTEPEQEGGQEGEEPVPTDTELPPVPTLYQRKYPQGIEGVWNEHKARIQSASLVTAVTGLLPSTIGSTGSCPSWPLNISLASWADFGTHDVAPPCWIWGVAKALLILGALLLARALVFGG